MTATQTLTAEDVVFKLDVHICDQRRGYVVGFFTEDQVMEFLARRNEQDESWREETGASWWSGGHAYCEVEGFPIPENWGRVWDFLYPLCEHGLSADLCAGPGHYPQDHPAYM
jgi:hypothetical protein